MTTTTQNTVAQNAVAEISEVLDDLAALNHRDPDAVARQDQILAAKQALIRRLQRANPPPPTGVTALTCARAGCINPVIRLPRQNGRPPIYCTPACRPSHKNHPQRGHISVELSQADDDTADNPGRSWTVALRRGPRSVTIGHDLGRFAATALANDLQQLIHPQTQHQGGPID
jgi:hypothetical protein